MKVLVVGGGGREHALVWKLTQSKKVRKIFCAPGNAGIGKMAECVNIKADKVEELLNFARFEGIDLTVVGPEAPLTLGIVDLFEKEGKRVFGVSKAAAQLEGSKVFAKELMRRYNIPSTEYKVFFSPIEAEKYVRMKGAPIIIKADGLAAGKGVFVCTTVEEAVEALDIIMRKRAFGAAGDRVVIEECLIGEEASFMAFSDGETVVPMASSQDHKRVFDHDKGPNTGGMGAYSPAPVVTPEMEERIMREVMLPTVRGMKQERMPYKGVLYAGIMMTESGPKVLEFNVRFGDPEAQPILMRLDSDILDIMLAVSDGTLKPEMVRWKNDASVCIVAAAKGYPGSYEKGFPITGLEEAAAMENTFVFHAGTADRKDAVVTNGGRVLGVTAIGQDVAEAISRAYAAITKIHFDGMHYRKDIGARALKR
ncbi:MAG: phosphoribosylamine--glycine ligase [Nitrospirae bacterium]|nr:phosphoribosylamine--glycine ligase [Nitrospirota bacterium]